MSNFNLITNIVERLEKCFHDINTQLHEFKQSSVKIKHSNEIHSNKDSKYEKKCEEKRNQNSSSSQEKQIKYKTKNEPVKYQNEIDDNLTCEQKKKLKKQIMKNGPKLPMNPFIAYVKAQKQRIKHHNSQNLSIAAITAIASHEWKVLPEEDKELYVKEYEQNRLVYLQKKDSFFQQNPILKKLNSKKFNSKKQPKSQLKPLKDEQYLDYLKIQNENLARERQNGSEVLLIKEGTEKEKEDYEEIQQRVFSKFDHQEVIEITKIQPCGDEQLSNFISSTPLNKASKPNQHLTINEKKSSDESLKDSKHDQLQTLKINCITKPKQTEIPPKACHCKNIQKLRKQAKQKLMSAIKNQHLQQNQNNLTLINQI